MRLTPGAQASRLTDLGAPVGIVPRLLNLRESAVYLSVSYWTLRDFVLAGYLPTVALPALRPRQGDHAKRQLRRVLIDRVDLDTFVEARKR